MELTGRLFLLNVKEKPGAIKGAIAKETIENMDRLDK